MVYPDALGIPPFESCWNTPGAMNLAGCGDHADDLLYISVLIDHVEELYEWTRSDWRRAAQPRTIRPHPASFRYNVDNDRIYAFGYSNGGAMTMTLACYLTDKIAAFGLTGAGPLYKAARGLGPCGHATTIGQMAVSGWTCPWGAREGQIPMLWIHSVHDPAANFRPRAGSSGSAGARLLARAQPAVPVGRLRLVELLEWVGSSRRPPCCRSRAQGAAAQGARSTVRRLPDARPRLRP